MRLVRHNMIVTFFQRKALLLEKMFLYSRLMHHILILFFMDFGSCYYTCWLVAKLVDCNPQPEFV